MIMLTSWYPLFKECHILIILLYGTANEFVLGKLSFGCEIYSIWLHLNNLSICFEVTDQRISKTYSSHLKKGEMQVYKPYHTI